MRSHEMKVTIIIIFFILIILSNLHSQGIPYGQEFQASFNSDILCEYPSVALLENGGFIVCWDGYWSPGHGLGSDIYGQIFDRDGLKVGTEIQVNSNIMGKQQTPYMIGLKNGGFVVVWLSETASWQLCGQVFDEAGNKIGSELVISESLLLVGNENNIAIAGLRDGGCITCWSGRINGVRSIVGQRFDAAGNKKGTPFKINTSFSNFERLPSVAGLHDGGFVVCWQSTTSYPMMCILGQVLDASGNKIGDEFQVTTSQYSWEFYQVVAGLEEGGFVVVWRVNLTAVSCWEIYGKWYDANGASRGDEFQLNSYADDEQLAPTVAALPEGGVVVCWQSWKSAKKLWDINGQLFDKNGGKVGYEFQVNRSINLSGNLPAAIALKSRGFVVCWQNGYYDYYKQITGNFLLNSPIIHELMTYGLIAPGNDVTLSTTRPVFRWQQPSAIRECYSWEIVFDLYLDTDISFSNPQIIKNIQDTTYTIDSLAAGKTYFWKVLAKNLAGDSLWSTQQDWGFFIKLGATLVGNVDNELPQNFELSQNHPNPFNSSTEIKYSLSSGSNGYQVQLKVYDILGRLVKVLVDQEQVAGTYSISWDGADQNGNSVPSGVYFYTLEVNTFRSIRKMLLIE